jgi:hypothetical protein
MRPLRVKIVTWGREANIEKKLACLERWCGNLHQGHYVLGMLAARLPYWANMMGGRAAHRGRFEMSVFSRLVKWLLLIAGGSVTQLLVSIGAHTALGAEPPNAPRGEIVLDQQLINQLRLFEKEIARSQYTEFCATVRMPPAGVIEHLEEASRAGDAHAQVLFMWVFRLIERYKEDGCGDT